MTTDDVLMVVGFDDALQRGRLPRPANWLPYSDDEISEWASESRRRSLATAYCRRRRDQARREMLAVIVAAPLILIAGVLLVVVAYAAIAF